MLCFSSLVSLFLYVSVVCTVLYYYIGYPFKFAMLYSSHMLSFTYGHFRQTVLLRDPILLLMTTVGARLSQRRLAMKETVVFAHLCLMTFP